MGGSGSGNWFRWDKRDTTESQHRIDSRYLKRIGFFGKGFVFGSGTLSWSRNGEKTGSIRYQIESNRMILNYRHRPRGGEWEDVEQVITLDRTPCNYGGSRTWFLCPRCLRRVAVLYGAGKYFFCRYCHNLAYESQNEDFAFRMLRKSRNIKEKLGVKDGIDSIIFKPKGMHQKTFDQLRFWAERYDYIGWTVAEEGSGECFPDVNV